MRRPARSLLGVRDARPDDGTTRNGADADLVPADARPVSCGSDIQFEPNDSRERATSLPVQPDVMLTSLVICPGTDQDFYAFEISQTENVRIALTYDAGLGDLDFDLINELGTTYIVNTTRTGNTTVYTGDSLHWGTWYVRVFATEPGVENSYDLDVHIGP